MAKKKFNIFNVDKEANVLVAKYVTGQTSPLSLWRNLYDFTEYVMKLAYTAGRREKTVTGEVKKLRTQVRKLRAQVRELTEDKKTAERYAERLSQPAVNNLRD